MIDEVVQRKLERAWLDLLVQHDREEHPAALDRFLACHLALLINSLPAQGKRCASLFIA